MFDALTPLVLFAAFILLLLVSLSVPIIKAIYLFRLYVSVSVLGSGGNGNVKFGVWGYCVSPIQVSIAGFDRSTAAECSSTRLGYTFDENVASALRVSGFDNVISRSLTTLLVLHPIVCALTFAAFLLSLFMWRRGGIGSSRLPSVLTLLLTLVAALISTVVFVAEVVLVVVVRNRVGDQSDGDTDIRLGWGNAVWMTLVATILLLVASFGACAGICGRRRARKAGTY